MTMEAPAEKSPQQEEGKQAAEVASGKICCHKCEKREDSVPAFMLHLFTKHGMKSHAKRKVKGTSCNYCGSDLHTRKRLLMHFATVPKCCRLLEKVEASMTVEEAEEEDKQDRAKDGYERRKRLPAKPGEEGYRQNGGNESREVKLTMHEKIMRFLPPEERGAWTTANEHSTGTRRTGETGKDEKADPEQDNRNNSMEMRHLQTRRLVGDWKVVLLVGCERYLDWEVERALKNCTREADAVIVRWEGVICKDGSFDRAGLKDWMERASAGCVTAVGWWRPKVLRKFNGGHLRSKEEPEGESRASTGTCSLLRKEALHTWAGMHLAAITTAAGGAAIVRIPSQEAEQAGSYWDEELGQDRLKLLGMKKSTNSRSQSACK